MSVMPSPSGCAQADLRDLDPRRATTTARRPGVGGGRPAAAAAARDAAARWSWWWSSCGPPPSWSSRPRSSWSLAGTWAAAVGAITVAAGGERSSNATTPAAPLTRISPFYRRHRRAASGVVGRPDVRRRAPAASAGRPVPMQAGDADAGQRRAGQGQPGGARPRLGGRRRPSGRGDRGRTGGTTGASGGYARPRAPPRCPWSRPSRREPSQQLVVGERRRRGCRPGPAETRSSTWPGRRRWAHLRSAHVQPVIVRALPAGARGSRWRRAAGRCRPRGTPWWSWRPCATDHNSSRRLTTLTNSFIQLCLVRQVTVCV